MFLVDMSEAIVRFANARMECVKCTVAGGMDPSTQAFLTLSKAAATAVNDQLMHMRVLAVEEGTILMKIVLDSPLEEADKTYLVEVLQKKTDLTVSKSVSSGPSSGKKDGGITMQRLVREER